MNQPDDASLIIDHDRYRVYRSNAVIHLTKTEFRVLELIAEAKGRILTRTQIAGAVGNGETKKYPRTIDVHISHIRKKVGPFGGRQIIVSFKGVGYKIIDGIDVRIRTE